MPPAHPRLTLALFPLSRHSFLAAPPPIQFYFSLFRDLGAVVAEELRYPFNCPFGLAIRENVALPFSEPRHIEQSSDTARLRADYPALQVAPGLIHAACSFFVSLFFSILA
ncbi:hypothetical protein GGI42DRAFT_327661 [Trichoderma sp. SZMC 28013]